MQVREILSSLTFRYLVKYVTALSAAVFLLLGTFYLYFSYTSFRELGETVLEELETLQLVYRGQSLAGVHQYIDDQMSSPAVHRFYYLVSDASGAKVAGNLPAQPSYRELDDGWLGFEMALQNWGEAVAVDFIARPMDLGDGYRAIVARDYADIVHRAELVFKTLFRVMIATVLLGVAGGFISAAVALRSVERLNREMSRIVGGDPGQRLRVDEEKGYVRTLAMGVNQMLDQMETLMQGVRRVSDNIAHDLRTPLTRMRNDLSQVRARLSGQEAVQLDRIVAECDELLTTFNALLRISTLESGSRLAGGGEVDLKALLMDVVELYEPLAQDRGISLEEQVGDEGVCRGEADLLFQMVANVLDNAIKYTPSGGRVYVALSASSKEEGNGECVITIADTGPGIAAVEHSNVFRRFYRVESSRSEQPGHGLGLSLVQAIVRYHHGSVELLDNDPGLTVRIRLPALILEADVVS